MGLDMGQDMAAEFDPPTKTDPLLHSLAGAALALLASDGVEGRDDDGATVWRTTFTGAQGEAIEVACTGTDIPTAIPDDIAPHQQIARERPWAGTYRLVVSAPLIVLDLYWSPREPMRIMGLSRGDWERDLLAR